MTELKPKVVKSAVAILKDLEKNKSRAKNPVKKKTVKVDAVLERILIEIIESGIVLAKKYVSHYDYSNANSHLSYVQGVIITALKTKSITKDKAKFYSAEILAITKRR